MTTSLPAQALQSTLSQKPDSVYLVDVRSPAEFRGQRLPFSDNRPIDRLNERVAKELAEAARGRQVCFICQSGKRSKMALTVWEKSGLGEAAELEGGLNAWSEAELPLEQGEGGAISIERQVRIAAGALVFIGVLLAAFVSPAWLFLPGFIGAGLVFAGVTDTCGMGMMLARMPWNR